MASPTADDNNKQLSIDMLKASLATQMPTPTPTPTASSSTMKSWTWHVYAIIVLAVLGVVAIIYMIYRLVVGDSSNAVPAPDMPTAPLAPLAPMPAFAPIPALAPQSQPLAFGGKGKGKSGRIRKSLLKAAKKALPRK